MIAMRLMSLIEVLNQDNPAQNPTIDEKIEYARPKIFNFTYPFFSEEERPLFETKFIRRYFLYCLGLETPALWSFFLNEALNRIMPYYNDLYKTTLFEIKPFQDIMLTETFQRDLTRDITGNEQADSSGTHTADNSGTLTGNDTNTKTGTDKIDSSETVDEQADHTGTQEVEHNLTHKYSDTPQGLAAGQDYLTNMYVDNGTDTTTNNLQDSLNRSTDGTSTTTYNTTDKRTIDNNTTENIDEKTTSTNSRDRSEMEKAIENYTHTKEGQSGKYSSMELIQQYRDIILNIDDMIIEDYSMRSLFAFYE